MFETSLYAARRWLRAPLAVAKELFLPIGYPGTVHDGYLHYQLYDSLQGLCSYLRGVLCSAQVLQAAGVGNENATAWAAALTWALKDGMGMTSGLVFSYVAAPLFDAHVKEFRLFADFINNVALTLDMLAPYSPSLLLVTSASTVCKTLCGMSAAATKASITHYFATTGNMADLNAKEATQETLVSLLGMMLGVTLARQLQWLEQQQKHEDGDESSSSLTSQTIQWTVFIILTAIHMWANWRGVYLLRLPTLNRERAELVLRGMVAEDDDEDEEEESSLKQSAQAAAAAASDSAATTTTRQRQRLVRLKPLAKMEFPSPDEIFESLLASTWKIMWPGRLQFQARVEDMVRAALRYNNHHDSVWILNELTTIGEITRKYLLYVTPRNVRIQVCLLRGASTVDELEAFCHAYLLQLHLARSPHNGSGGGPPRLDHETVLEYGQMLKPLFGRDNNKNKNKSLDKNATPTILSKLQQKGWDVNDGRLYLGFPRRRTELLRLDDDNPLDHAAKKKEE